MTLHPFSPTDPEAQASGDTDALTIFATSIGHRSSPDCSMHAPAGVVPQSRAWNNPIGSDDDDSSRTTKKRTCPSSNTSESRADVRLRPSSSRRARRPAHGLRMTSWSSTLRDVKRDENQGIERWLWSTRSQSSAQCGAPQSFGTSA